MVGYDTETGKTVAPSSAEQASESELAALGIPVRKAPRKLGTPSPIRAYSYFVGEVPGLSVGRLTIRQAG